MLDLFSFFYSKLGKYIHQSLGTEQTHQVILQRNIESGFSRIALTSGTSTQLVVNTTGLMTFCTDDLQSAGCS